MNLLVSFDVASEFKGSLLVFTTPVSKLVSDFLEDRHGP
jgi:hypothetical protein